MGFIVISSNGDNICYQIIINHDESSSELVKFLDEAAIKFEHDRSVKFDRNTERAMKQREEYVSFGGHDIVYRFTLGCKVYALSLVNFLRKEYGCSLANVTSNGTDGGLVYVLTRQTQWRASIPFLAHEK